MIEITGPGYGRRKTFKPVSTLIAVIQGLLGLIGVLILILFFYTGSFTAAGERTDEALQAAKSFVTSLWP